MHFETCYVRHLLATKDNLVAMLTAMLTLWFQYDLTHQFRKDMQSVNQSEVNYILVSSQLGGSRGCVIAKQLSLL